MRRTDLGHECSELRRGARLAPRVLARGAIVRAAFVPTQAGPLAGDEDRVRIVVGAGATLVVEPVAATLALPGTAAIVLTLDVTVLEGGCLVLDEAALIVAAGADVTRRCTVELGRGAVAALRESVVLGRDGEPPGALDSVLRVTLAGRPLLHDGLRACAASAISDAHVALAPGHRVLSTVCLLGLRPEGAEAFALAGPGALRRATGPSLAGVEAAIAPTWLAWSARALALSGAAACGRPAAAASASAAG
ncbi:MAG: urease accessory protein [Solirubrobacteraceae bacterium]|nr:urease accessory protein [Solirubrobacteraceae bacterium]